MSAVLALVIVLVLAVAAFVVVRSKAPPPFDCKQADGSPCNEPKPRDVAAQLAAYQVAIRAYSGQEILFYNSALRALQRGSDDYALLGSGTKVAKPSDPSYALAAQDFLALVATLRPPLTPVVTQAMNWKASDIVPLLGASLPIEQVAESASKVFDQLKGRLAAFETAYSVWEGEAKKPGIKNGIAEYYSKNVEPLGGQLAELQKTLAAAVSSAQVLANAAIYG